MTINLKTVRGVVIGLMFIVSLAYAVSGFVKYAFRQPSPIFHQGDIVVPITGNTDVVGIVLKPVCRLGA